MPIEKKEVTTYYVSVWDRCGNEFRVYKDSKETTCYNCLREQAMQEANAQLSSWIGATIVSVECDNYRMGVSEHKLSEMMIVTTHGGRYTITCDHDDMGSYMEWERE